MALRGDVNKVLNRLVREGVISGFKTNFDGPSEALGLHVLVTPASASNPERVRRAVAEALADIAEDVTVTVNRG